ncbi:response regulator [Marinovum sp.]|uniref:response regulator n=1 Tax=Marinovum sp. TaxID=2024839 RepID=UPI002B274A84|nr:response regulator [Marinovum sp.]
MGFLLQPFSDAETALNFVDEFTPDLFLLDIDMPEMTGWELAEALRARPKYRATPIVMVTGHALEARQPVDRERLYDAFVVKPYSLNDLVSRLSRLLNVELTFDAPSEPAPATNGLPLEAVRRLIGLADIGHAAGVRRELDVLVRDGALDAALRRRLDGHLAQYDLSSVARVLKEIEQ